MTNQSPITYYYDVQQHSEQWYKLKCGVISASIMKNFISKKTDKKTGEVTYSIPDPEKTKAYVFEIAAQRVNGDAADGFQSYAMLRGLQDEVDAFNLYSAKYEQLKTCGFITNSRHGFLLGYSPDGLTALNDDGQAEFKSREPKFQAETIFNDEMPDDFDIQTQTGLIVTERKWIDFGSYCGGMPFFKKRIEPNLELQKIIILAAQAAEKQIQQVVKVIQSNIVKYDFAPTVKRVEDITA